LELGTPQKIPNFAHNQNAQAKDQFNASFFGLLWSEHASLTAKT
jgi:hypothetical protein